MRARAPKPQSASRFLRERRDGTKPERVNAPGQGRKQTYFPTPEDRENVERLAGLLAPYDEIAEFMKISRDTLLRHYREELIAASTWAGSAAAGP
jgi:DNA invertase Pin-like site-specific DNA recombinase